MTVYVHHFKKYYKLRHLGGLDRPPTSAQVMASQFVGSSPTSGSELTEL